MIFGLSAEAAVALLQGLIMFADWAWAKFREIVAANQAGVITEEMWAKWDADILAAHNEVQRV